MGAALTLTSVLAVMSPAGDPETGGTMFTSQIRFVNGMAFADDGFDPTGDSDMVEALDFGPFNEGASASVNLDDIALGTGGGTQDSVLMASGCTAVGSAFATAESFDGKGSADGSGFSRFVVEFDLPVDADFTLLGDVAAFDSGLTFVSLRDRQIEYFGVTVVGTATRLPVDESGTLPAGSYTLEIESSGSAFADPFTSEFAFAEYDLAFNVDLSGAIPAVGPFGLAILVISLLLAGAVIAVRKRESKCM